MSCWERLPPLPRTPAGRAVPEASARLTTRSQAAPERKREAVAASTRRKAGWERAAAGTWTDAPPAAAADAAALMDMRRSRGDSPTAAASAPSTRCTAGKGFASRRGWAAEPCRAARPSVSAAAPALAEVRCSGEPATIERRGASDDAAVARRPENQLLRGAAEDEEEEEEEEGGAALEDGEAASESEEAIAEVSGRITSRSQT
jgi:hypothetical protein